MGEMWVGIAEVSRTTDIPERTLRRYVDRHGEFLPARRRGRTYELAQSAVPLVQRIRDWYATGMSAEAIDETLRQQYPVTITIGPEATTTAVVPEGFETLRQQLGQMLAAVAERQEAERNELATIYRSLVALRDRLEELDSVRADFRRLADHLGAWQQQVVRLGEEQRRALEERDQYIVSAMRQMLSVRPEPWWTRLWGIGRAPGKRPDAAGERGAPSQSA
ncbi:MAG: MerR family transcriptional regulator [Actinomycetia bacterium]|nr:MerR family transcriptional regulator [Actinomycetes bacterium]